MASSTETVRRSARAVLQGPALLEFITTPRTREVLVAAAEAGHPPVASISEDIRQLIGLKDAKLLPVRQFVGRCVRAVLEEAGFEVAAAGVRLSHDRIFRSGSVYQRASHPAPVTSREIVEWLITKLTDSEAELALKLIQTRLRRSRAKHGPERPNAARNRAR
jgi:hypothetical protein